MSDFNFVGLASLYSNHSDFEKMINLRNSGSVFVLRSENLVHFSTPLEMR